MRAIEKNQFSEPEINQFNRGPGLGPASRAVTAEQAAGGWCQRPRWMWFSPAPLQRAGTRGRVSCVGDQKNALYPSAQVRRSGNRDNRGCGRDIRAWIPFLVCVLRGSGALRVAEGHARDVSLPRACTAVPMGNPTVIAFIMRAFRHRLEPAERRAGRAHRRFFWRISGPFPPAVANRLLLSKCSRRRRRPTRAWRWHVRVRG